MANKKISELTAATTIAGIETLPVVQSSTTKSSTANLLRGYTKILHGAGSATTDRAITITGAATGDMCIVTSRDSSGYVCTGYVSATNTVTVKLSSISGLEYAGAATFDILVLSFA